MDGTTEYQSMIVYHHNSPSWMETVRLAVPIEKFYGSHVRLEYRHCSSKHLLPIGNNKLNFILRSFEYFNNFLFFSTAREKADNKKLFGFSFARLMETGGATLCDGPHELYIYKCEDRSRLNDPQVYLSLPSGARETAEGIGQTSSNSFGRSHKETVFINTLLCSTKLTQNGETNLNAPMLCLKVLLTHSRINQIYFQLIYCLYFNGGNLHILNVYKMH